jgi:hypothetical protein
MLRAALAGRCAGASQRDALPSSRHHRRTSHRSDEENRARRATIARIRCESV